MEGGTQRRLGQTFFDKLGGLFVITCHYSTLYGKTPQNLQHNSKAMVLGGYTGSGASGAQVSVCRIHLAVRHFCERNQARLLSKSESPDKICCVPGPQFGARQLRRDEWLGRAAPNAASALRFALFYVPLWGNWEWRQRDGEDRRVVCVCLFVCLLMSVCL